MRLWIQNLTMDVEMILMIVFGLIFVAIVYIVAAPLILLSFIIRRLR